MRKFLLFGIGLVLGGTVSAQNFTTQTDTVKAAIGSNSANIHNNITNSTTSPIKIEWKVIGTDFPAAWLAPNVLGMCDNANCYNNGGNALLDLSFESNDYAPGVPGDYHMQLTNFSTVPGGSHYMSVRLTNGAQADTITFVVTKWATGITSTVKTTDDVVIYPNPAGDEVNILFDAKANIRNITMYNLIGKAVRVYKVSGSSAKLDINDMPSGIYFIRLQDAQGRVVATRKLTHQ